MNLKCGYCAEEHNVRSLVLMDDREYICTRCVDAEANELAQMSSDRLMELLVEGING